MRKLLLLLTVALCITGCDKDMVDRAELDNANAKIEQLNKELASLKDSIAKRDTTIADKDRAIENSDKKVEKANDTLVLLRQRLDERDATISNLNAMIADLQDEGITNEAEPNTSLGSIVKLIAPYSTISTIAGLLILIVGSVWTIILLRKVKKACHAPSPAPANDSDEPDDDEDETQPEPTVPGQAVPSRDVVKPIDDKNKNSKKDQKDKIREAERERDEHKKQLNDKDRELRDKNKELEKVQKDNNVKDNKIKELDKTISNLTIEKANTQKALDDTTSRLRGTTESLNKTIAEVHRLEEAQAAFTKELASVPFAQSYCQSIVRLTEVVKDITTKGVALLDKDLSDKYFIYKALATFTQRLDKFKQMDFATEVKMAAQSHFALKTSRIAGYDQSQTPDKLEKATKQHFFDTYLKTYLNAAVVLNETLAGMHHLIDDLDAPSCKAFDDLRTRLDNACRDLGIEVSCVKVFDNVGQNTNLQVVSSVPFDSGNSGQILEIKNCSVKLAGGMMPHEKIQVIVKE